VTPEPRGAGSPAPHEDTFNGDAPMNDVKRNFKRFLRVGLSTALVSIFVHAGAALADDVTVSLSGQQEIPPVTTTATGTGTLSVGPDKSITGKLTVSGMSVTVAHIHEAAAGSNGPIIIPLTRTSDTVWVVPAGAKLTDAQYESYKAGKLYFNIHSEAHKSGEIRGQIRP
jgi:hypothetical protein